MPSASGERCASLLLLVGLLPAFALGCSPSGDARPAPADTLVVFEAASLAVPMRAALDTFARRSGAVVNEEHGASLELARRVTELQRIPDVIALADYEVFPELLVPRATPWFATFARNRMVIAYTDRSRHAAEMTGETWRAVLQRPDVAVGRADPMLAPAGYRALLTFVLAESHYRDKGLARRLEARTPPAHMRGNAAELAALLSAGELDYIVEYESLARAQKFRFITLPPEIDLGDQRYASAYAAASVPVWNGKDSVTRRGTPILYGISIPRAARHPGAAIRFVRFLLGEEGRALLRRGSVDALETPTVVGDSAPGLLPGKR